MCDIMCDNSKYKLVILLNYYFKLLNMPIVSIVCRRIIFLIVLKKMVRRHRPLLCCREIKDFCFLYPQCLTKKIK